MRPVVRTAAALGVATALLSTGVAVAWSDYGSDRDDSLNNQARKLFGVQRGIPSSSTLDLTEAEALAKPAALLTVARGLRTRVISSGVAGADLDMGVLWPQHRPTHLLFCNESGPTDPGVQSIDLKTGAATTLLTGTAGCDPLNATPWGTILIGEEVGPSSQGATGSVWEIIDPLSLKNETIDRAAGTSSSPNVVRRDALGFLAFEGIGILPNGVTYHGDEQSASGGVAGGSYFKFVPTTPSSGDQPIESLQESPLVAGTVYGLRIGSSSNYGHGISYGTGTWRSVDSGKANLRAAAVAGKLTGYYRPEDLNLDEAALDHGDVRWCGPNTGRDSARYWGEVVCLTDGNTETATAGTSVPQMQLLVQGSPEFNMPDNIAFQPGRGNWIVHEDGSTAGHPDGARNNDIWSCLDDGYDDDTLTDGCLRIATVNDLDAETTGGFFDPTGTRFYVSIQHNSSGFGTVLEITGWR